jgi:EAL domain-containing protein (putative c-di-GMP-specific phosphodiesterase class I)
MDDLALPLPQAPYRILLVDDDDRVRQAYVRLLTAEGLEVVPASSGEAAVRLLAQQRFDAVISDVMMPGMSGLDLLRAVRAQDLDVSVILMTGVPMLEGAVQAVEYGALRYLTKPIAGAELTRNVRRAGQLGRMARVERAALAFAGGLQKLTADRAGLEAVFERALAGLRVVYQPIVSARRQVVVAYEALLRSSEPALATPMLLLDAAERLSEVHRLGRAIRARAAHDLLTAPLDLKLFVNLHPLDLLDDALYDPQAPLTAYAKRVTLEITERHGLDGVSAVELRVARLRALGFRIAIDDLGAGYAGLSSFAQLEPEVVKLDISLVHDIHREPTRRKLVQSMVQLCADLGMEVICEGVETVAERDVLCALGGDLLQGFLFARPGVPFPPVIFGA